MDKSQSDLLHAIPDDHYNTATLKLGFAQSLLRLSIEDLDSVEGALNGTNALRVVEDLLNQVDEELGHVQPVRQKAEAREGVRDA